MVAGPVWAERVSATWQPALRRCLADFGRFWLIAYVVAVHYLLLHGVLTWDRPKSLDALITWALEAYLFPFVAAWWMLTTPLLVVPLAVLGCFLLPHGLSVLCARARRGVSTAAVLRQPPSA